MNIAWLCEECKTQQIFTAVEMYGETIIHCGVCNYEYRIKWETFLDVQKTDQERGYIEITHKPRWITADIEIRQQHFTPVTGKTTRL